MINNDMINNGQHDIVVDPNGKQRLKRVKLAEFDGQRMAVVLKRGRKQIVIRGKATFVRDTTIGNCLKIHLQNDEPGEPILILSEGEWQGRIVPDFHYGCDFCLVLG